MYTRKQYLNKECDHAAYYAQFVDAGVKNLVLRRIGRKAIGESTEDHFNDIALVKWDSVFYGGVPHRICNKLRELGDYPTKAGVVCIVKEAARQIKEAA